MPQRQRHHDRKRQPHAGLHRRQAPEVMALEAEPAVEAAVDPFRYRANQAFYASGQIAQRLLRAVQYGLLPEKARPRYIEIPSITSLSGH